MISNRIFNHLDELLLGCGGPDLVSVKQLDHKTGKALESSWYPDCGAHLNEHILCSLNVDLKLASLVNRRVQQSKKALKQ